MRDGVHRGADRHGADDLVKQSAAVAHKKSNEIMEQFKAIDRDLKKTDTRLDSLNKTGFDSLINANK